MKRFVSFVLSVLLLMSVIQTGFAEEWTCPECGATATGNFCSECGGKRPEDGSWICPECGAESSGKFCSNCGAKHDESTVRSEDNTGKVQLDLSIAFEKNAYFSTYDVKLFVDDELITTMRHGIDYTGTVYVAPGKHVILFQEESSFYPSEGSAVITVEGPSLYKCEIHAKMDAIQITDENLESASSDDSADTKKKKAVKVDGDLKLKVSIEFRKNGMLSQYDVDMYCDDTFIATLPHGKNYEGTLLVSKGKHTIMFYKSGSKKVRGSVSFKVSKDAAFSCRIEAKQNKVKITKDKLK